MTFGQQEFDALSQMRVKDPTETKKQAAEESIYIEFRVIS